MVAVLVTCVCMIDDSEVEWLKSRTHIYCMIASWGQDFGRHMDGSGLSSLFEILIRLAQKSKGVRGSMGSLWLSSGGLCPDHGDFILMTGRFS